MEHPFRHRDARHSPGLRSGRPTYGRLSLATPARSFSRAWASHVTQNSVPSP